MTEQPRGTVTFLFTDVEASTRLWQVHAAAMPAAYERHDTLLREAITAQGGIVYKTIGDALQAAFPTGPDAVVATLEAQRGLVSEDWAACGLPEPLRVRMALHAGAAEPSPDGDYRSPILNRLGRLLAAGHGGQILLSATVQELVRDHLPIGVGLRDLGEQHLKDLYRPERVWQLLHPTLPAAFPPLRTLETRPNNLPLQPTPFLGREREVAQVVERLRDPEVRLLTLTGPGGTGKTRLALQAAAELVDDFADGVFFVPLAALTDPELVPAAVAEAVGVREAGGRPLREQLRDALEPKAVLLVLDNVEHLPGAAPLVGELVAGPPRLTALVTSRGPLRLRAEREYPVPPLALPRRKPPPTAVQLGQYEAVRLFIARAQAVRPDFLVTNENAPAVAEICHRLDGLPLAIELAAARVRLLPPQAMLARLEQRLGLLTGGARDAPARQRTLREAIAWSDDLLTADERKLFRRLAVFAGGWTAEAAEAVTGGPGSEELGLEVFDGLERLAEHSLLRQAGASGGEPRFAMLETIREFGLEQLSAHGEAERLRDAHAAYFLDLAEGAEPQLTGPEQVRWLNQLEAEHDNLRAALAWLEQQGKAEYGLRLASALWMFWLVRGHLNEGRGWLERALAIGSNAPPGTLSKALNNLGNIAFTLNDYAKARSAYEESLALRRVIDDSRGVAATLNNLGLVAEYEGNYDRARTIYQENLALSREMRDQRGLATALQNLGHLTELEGDYPQAHRLHEEALTIRQQVGDTNGVAYSLWYLGKVTGHEGDDATARSLFEQSLALFNQVGNTLGVGYALHGLGGVAYREGAYQQAATHYMEALEQHREAGEPLAIVECIEGLAQVASAQGQSVHAVRFFSAAEATRDVLGAPMPSGVRAIRGRCLTDARAALGDAAFNDARVAGRTLSLAQASVEASSLYQ